uniref:Zinc finger protein 671 n=1 Tax=Mandrillus leucophaeus TaxID=9568 RepID=A0A2K5XHP2_MANLE
MLSPASRDAAEALRGWKYLRPRSRRLPLPAAVRAHGPVAELTDSARELHFLDHVQSLN